MSTVVLKIDKLIKSYKPTGTIKFELNINNLEVAEGEIFSLLGPNGSGKTTLIKLILNLISHDSGLIKILGINHTAKMARKSIGYLPEDFIIPNNYKFKDIAIMYGMLYQYTRNEVEKYVDNICSELNLTNLFNIRVNKLSKGMRQSLGLVTSLIGEKKILILDEPFNSLDPVQRKRVVDYLLKLNKENNVTIISTTHILSDVEEFSTKIGLFNDGKIININFIEKVLIDCGSVHKYYLKYFNQ